MKRLASRICLGLACLLAVPAVANAQFANKRTVSSKKKSSKKARKKSRRTVKRRAKRRPTVKKTRTSRKVVTTSRQPVRGGGAKAKAPSRLKAPPGRRAPRTRAPRGRRGGYYGDGGYYGRRRGYNAGYNDGYDDARYRNRRSGGSAGGQSAPRRDPGPPQWSGGLLLGGVGGETSFAQTEHETSLGFFGELNLRGAVTRNVSVGIHGGMMHNQVQSSAVDSVLLGSVGADLAVHFSRGRNSPYLRGGAGFAHATLDPTDAFAPEATGGGWYAKAGVGVSLGMLLIEGNCTQFNFDELAIPGGPGTESEIVRCGIGLGFGR